MSAPNATPGPWPISMAGDGKRIIVGAELVEGPNGYEVAEVYSDDCPWSVALANANLIAASPKLYEAGQRLIEAEDAQDGDALEDAINTLRAALALARGGAA